MLSPARQAAFVRLVRLLFGASSALLVAACDEPPVPWAGTPDGKVRDESTPFLPSAPAPLTEPAPSGSASAASAPPEASSPPAPKGLGFGGLWSSCHRGFSPSGEPRRDVTRLATSCGPVNGMHRLGDLVTATVSPDRPLQHRVAVERDACLRVFAAAGDAIANLEVQVWGPDGEELGRDQTSAPWAVVEPARPLCSPRAGDLVIRAATRRGSGPVALAIWGMGPRGSR